MYRLISCATILIGFSSLALSQGSTAPGTNGLGLSTLTCIDRDGDGYGTGPGVVINTTSSAISAGVQTITPASMTGISANSKLRIGNWPNLEYVLVTSITGTTFTATFTGAHSGTVPITDTNCLGPDADDQSAGIHTWPQAKSAYGSFTAWNTKFGYAPTHTWYLAPASATAACLANLASGEPTSSCSGNDSTGVEDDSTHPFATWARINAAVTAGMMVVMRDGFNDRIVPANSGSSGKPIIFLGFPGELPNFDLSLASNGIYLSSRSWIIVDNAWAHSGQGCWTGGDTNYATAPHDFHDIIYRHIVGGPLCKEGYGPLVGFSNLTIEDSLFYNNNGSNDEAGIYVGSGCTASTGLTLQRDISFGNNNSGYHLNGLVVGGLLQQLVSYSNGIEGITFQSAVNNTTLQSSLSINNTGPDFSIYTYKANGLSAYECDFGPYTATGATWSSGTATVTLNSSHTMIVGQNVYIYGIIPSGYNCLGMGCVLTAVNQSAGTISYTVPGNPGAFSSGSSSYVESGAYDQNGNLIQNNTFYHGNEAAGGVALSQTANVLIMNKDNTTHLPDPSFNLGGNTFRNNIFVNYGDCAVAGLTCVNNATYREPPIQFYNGLTGASGEPTYPATTTFDHNLFFQTNGVNGGTGVIGIGDSAVTGSNTCTSNCNGRVVYDIKGNPLNGGGAIAITTGGMTGNLNSDPKLINVSTVYYSTPGAFNFSLNAASPAIGAGSTASVPAYDLVGNAYATNPSTGAIEEAPASSPTPTPPTVSVTAPAAGANVSGTVSASATATASGPLSIASVQFQVDSINLGSPVTSGPTYVTSWNTTGYANGPHSLTAVATDSGGNTGSASVTVTINNTAVAPPVISSVIANSITYSSATITWTTTTPSSSQVFYGTIPSYGQTSALQSSLATSHSIALSGLSASTVYYYEVLSQDSSGNLVTSGGYTLGTSAATASGTGWTDLGPATKLQSVCPPNDFNGINYNFATDCPAVTAAWSSGVADTTRNRLIIWGGGHTDYSGNEVYSLNLGSGAPTITRLTNPSDFTQNTGCPDANVVDGTPVSRHTYGGIVYLPVQNKMYSFGGGIAPCGTWSGSTYTLDLSQAPPTWSKMDPVNGYSLLGTYFSTNAICGYDTNTATVICTTSNIFFRYDPATNTNTKLSNQFIPLNANGVIDPKRKLFIFMGPAYQSTTPTIYAVDISSGSTFQAQNWSSQVTGCNVLASTNYPGLVYDPVLDRIVGWPNSGNTVYIFDEDTKTCTTQTFANGPTNSASSTQGTFGRFQYFPGLNTYALVTSTSLDAFTLNLSAAAAQTPNPCDVANQGTVGLTDVQAAINQALGITACGTAALQQPGQCNVVDVQRVVNAALGGSCRTGP
jgi:hypothetical protein